MQSITLQNGDWQSVLDAISKSPAGSTATITVSGKDIGVQTEAENVKFLGISYDPKDHDVSIELEGIDHRISEPKQIELAHDGGKLISMEIVAPDEVRHIVSFEPALPLPSVAGMG
jgi:hypothetical protein